MKFIRDRGLKCPALANSVIATLIFATLAGGELPAAAQSQLIIPAVDGTGTQITQDGDQFVVTGGQLSGTGRNLFHSFTDFGLNQGQIANFLSRPTIQNILTRVSGGNVSVIDGLLRVTGGNSNLFLMNPAGIIFGANARLDVPGSFTATTATGIGFGNNQWFNTVGTPDYAQLIGDPSGFAFATTTPGAIANLGQLAVLNGQSLTLLGGSVLNLGELSAPGGQVTVAAVSGGNWVRLSQTGSLLSFDIQPLPAGTEPFSPTRPIPTLPQLLTGGTLNNANQVTVNPDGSLRLAGSTLDLPTTPGSTLISGQISADSSTLPTPGSVTLLGQTVALVNATVDASGLQGGTVRIGGDYQGRGAIPNAQRTFIDPGTVIRANGLNPDGANALGDGGRVIAWADQVTQFYGQIEAKGGDRAGNGGFVEVSGKRHLTYQGGTNVSAPAGRSGTLLLDPENIWIAPDGTGQNDDLAFPANTLTINALDFAGTLTLSKNLVAGVQGDLILAATNNIEFLLPAGDFLQFNENITSITLTADGDGDGAGAVLGQGIGLFASPFATTAINISGAEINLGSISTAAIVDAGAVNLSGTNITVDSISTFSSDGWGGAVSVNGTGLVSVGSINTTSTVGDGGSVDLGGTEIYVGSIDTFSTEGWGGSVFANSAGILSVGSINTTSTVGDGGAVTLFGSDLWVNSINTFSTEGWGGSVFIDSLGPVSVGDINTTSTFGAGGAVTLFGADLWVNSINTFSTGGWGGAVFIDSLGTVSVGDINTTSTVGDGGAVTLFGSDLWVNSINTFSTEGWGGAVSANSTGLLSVGSINTTSTVGDGGSVGLSGTEIYMGSIDTFSSNGWGGSVFANSAGILSMDSINTASTIGNGGAVTLFGSDVWVNSITTFSFEGWGGSVFIDSLGPVSVGDINTTSTAGDGGAVSMNGAGILSVGSINTASTVGPGGSVDLSSTDIYVGSIDTFSTDGWGGSVFASSAGILSVGDINTTSTVGDGGAVTLFGSDLGVNSINTFSTEGWGGAVFIDSLGPVSVGDINTTSTVGDGGAVTLLGSDLWVNSINTFSTEGWGGAVSANSAGLLSVGSINTSSTVRDGGTVGLSSTDIYVGSINTFSTEGWGGSVFADSAGILSVGDINTASTVGPGGAVTLLGADQWVNSINTFSFEGLGGTVFANSTGILSVGSIYTASAIADGGTVDLSGADLWADSVITASGTNGGGVAMSGTWISVGEIITSASEGNSGNSGNIRLFGEQSVQTGTLITSTQAEFGGAGAIDLSSITGDLITGDLFADAPNGFGGEVSVYTEQGSLFTGAIVTAGLLVGGNVTIAAPSPEQTVNFQSIDSSSGLGLGGNVLILAGQFVKGTGQTTANPNATILTTGAIAPGQVTIEHGGGGNRLPFVVGAEISNGLVGEIITGIDNVVASPPSLFSRNYTSPAGWITITGAESAEAAAPWVDDVQALTAKTDSDSDSDSDNETPDAKLVSGERANDTDAVIADTPADLDEDVSAEFAGHLELPEDKNTPSFSPGQQLQAIQTLTGIRPALIYLNYAPAIVQTTEPSPAIGAAVATRDASRRLRAKAVLPSTGTPDPGLALTELDSTPIAQARLAPVEQHKSLAQAPAPGRSSLTAQPTDQLEVVLVTADGRSQRKIIPGATRAQVQATVQQFLLDISDPRKTRSKAYLATAQQLYRWIVQPIEAELVSRNISNLSFIADTGLRFIPLAALHDGKQFLVEKYSIGLMPSLSLTDTGFVSLKNEPVLAMGASEFASKPELPAVPTELSLITQQIRSGQSYLNQDFTLDNLRTQRQRFKIVHLATHGEFQAGAIGNSYIQLWDAQLRLDQIRQLGWRNPPVELLVLSACRTALGSDEAELGFAGFAVQSGVRSAIASLWSVSDEGTLGLMTEFYRQLDVAPVRAEALRQAQIAMAQGRVKFVNGQLQDASGRVTPLPPSLSQIGDRDLTHPYYWAAFTMIGSPW